MKYLLKHITQLQLPTMILLSVCALCLWIPSFHTGATGATISTFLLSILNTIGIIVVCYKRGISRMYDLFSGYIYLLITSVLLPWHPCWQGQLVVTAILTAYLILLNVDRHSNSSASEEAFLATLILCVVSYWLPSVLFLLLGVIGVLIQRKSFDGKSFIAIHMAALLVAIYAAFAIYLGWIDFSWLNFFDETTLLYWIPTASLVGALILNAFFYSREHISRGIVFLVYLVLCIAGYAVQLIAL